MAQYGFGDLVQIDFPFAEGVGSKRRPAVVVSSSKLNQGWPDVTVMAISSQPWLANAYGVLRIHDHHSCNLSVESYIKPVFVTVTKPRAGKVTGHLDKITMAYLRRILSEIIG